jgi:flagellar basal-body rod modification protein FlgD
MSISDVASALTASTGSTSGSLSSLSGNEQTFLQLLTTQLQNQDPLAPTDTNTFTQQLVEYSQVEQQINTNSKLDTMTGLMVSNKVQDALSTVGAYVQYSGSALAYNGGTVEVDYNLPTAAATNTIQIQDANGNTVYTAQGAVAAGNGSVQWNGIENNGTQAPDGTYNVVINAVDSTGAAVAATSSVWGQVTGVQATSTDILLSLQGGNTIPFNSISNVSSTPTTQTSASNNNSNSSGS